MNSTMELVIREETRADVIAIHEVNATAFKTDAEARLVDTLRAAGALILSLVAEVEGKIIGHIAFSPVTVTFGERTFTGLGLAPMAVLPANQRLGIGGKLITEGLRRLREAGHPFCVVLGHSDYYPRHGFSLASTFGIRWEHPVPDEVFFVQELAPEGLKSVSGTVHYRPEFDAV